MASGFDRDLRGRKDLQLGGVGWGRVGKGERTFRFLAFEQVDGDTPFFEIRKQD